MKIILERRFFKVNEAGDNEFDNLLSSLGIDEDETYLIDEIDIDINDIEFK